MNQGQLFDPPPTKKGKLFYRTELSKKTKKNTWNGYKCSDPECTFTGISETVCPYCGEETVPASVRLN